MASVVVAPVAPMPVLSHTLPLLPLPDPETLPNRCPGLVYVRYAHRSHGKQVIRKHLRGKKHKFGLSRTDDLPSPRVLFYWVQREWQFPDHYVDTFDTQPCIAHIPLQRLLCNKVEAAETMREYYGEDAWTFVPESFAIRCMNIEQRGYDLSEVYDVVSRKADEKWIIKSNLGYFGIEVHVWDGDTVEDLHRFILEHFETNNFEEHFVDKEYPRNGRGEVVSARGNDLVMQKYIENPLLCDKRKFDLRCYCLIANVDPCIAFFHPGKMRLSGVNYNNDKLDEKDGSSEWVHKTNCHIQRLHDDYVHSENAIDGKEMLRNWQQFMEWMFSIQASFDDDWFQAFGQRFDRTDLTLETMTNLVELKIMEVLGKTVDACGDYFDKSTTLPNREGSFAFHGVDIMIDEEGVFWWLETNRVPALNMAGPREISVLTETLLQEMIDIELEVRDRRMRGERLLDENNLPVPLDSAHAWKPIPLFYYGKERELNQEVLATLPPPPERVLPEGYGV